MNKIFTNVRIISLDDNDHDLMDQSLGHHRRNSDMLASFGFSICETTVLPYRFSIKSRYTDSLFSIAHEPKNHDGYIFVSRSVNLDLAASAARSKVTAQRKF